MGTDITKPGDPLAEFREKLQGKIRKDIARLLPDDAIDAMIRDTVRDFFFKEQVKRDNYGHETRKPSWFQEAVVEAAKPLMKDAIDRFLALPETRGMLDKAMDDFLREQNLTLLAVSALGVEITNAFKESMSMAIAAIRNQRFS